MRIFRDFTYFPPNAARTIAADWQEISSNYLARTWSIAFGPLWKINKVQECAIRSLAFIAGIALLPFTLTGMILRACSTSHKSAFDLKLPEPKKKPSTFTPIIQMDNWVTPPSSPTPAPSPTPIEKLTQTALLKKVENFAHCPELTGIVKRLLCPFENELETTIVNDSDKLVLTVHETMEPWAKIKSPQSRLPYDFYLKPINGKYTFTICNNRVLDLGGSLILKKVSRDRQKAIINSYDCAQRWGAYLAGINLSKTVQTNLELSSESMTIQKLTFIKKEVMLIKAEITPLSQSDAANQLKLEQDLTAKFKSHGAGCVRKFAQSAIAFGEMLTGLNGGGYASAILKFLNPVGDAKGEGSDPGRITWYHGNQPIERAPFNS